MSDNNSFLSNYGSKKPEETPAPVTEKKLTFEQKSGFKKPERSGTRPPENGTDKKRLFTALIAGGAALIVIIIVLIIALSGGGVEVIDLKGKTLTDAKLWASENGVMLSESKEYSDTVEEGSIISQDVEPGQKLPSGRFLTVTVSLGHDMSVMVPLPDFMSMTSDDVKAWADENYMSKVRITAEFSADVPAGKVISFNVNDSTAVKEVRRDSAIVVVVSKGPQEETATIKVPDFKTKSLAECYAFAQENGITLTVKEEYDNYIAAGTIMSQSVKADQMVAKGSEIVLVVSKGKMITVPDFSGYLKDQASAVASELGLPVSITEKYSSASKGRLISQSAPAGSVYKAGDIVELKYSLGNKIVVSSYVGQTRDAIETWAQGLNDQGAKITIKVSEAKSNEKRGTIIYQDVANTTVGYKATINITVSAGKGIYVPDFVIENASGYDQAITRDKAITMCEKAGLIPSFVQDNTIAVLPDTISSQSLAPGTEVTEGTVITLLFRPAVTVTVPDFTKMTVAQAKGYLKQNQIVFANDNEDGSIIAQSVAAGSTVASGSVITLTTDGISPSPSTSP